MQHSPTNALQKDIQGLEHRREVTRPSLWHVRGYFLLQAEDDDTTAIVLDLSYPTEVIIEIMTACPPVMGITLD